MNQSQRGSLAQWCCCWVCAVDFCTLCNKIYVARHARTLILITSLLADYHCTQQPKDSSLPARPKLNLRCVKPALRTISLSSKIRGRMCRSSWRNGEKVSKLCTCVGLCVHTYIQTYAWIYLTACHCSCRALKAILIFMSLFIYLYMYLLIAYAYAHANMQTYIHMYSTHKFIAHYCCCWRVTLSSVAAFAVKLPSRPAARRPSGNLSAMQFLSVQRINVQQ